jgi:cell volume regulation protein A
MEIEHFHTALASLAEIVVFVALGLTVDLGSLDLRHIWIDGIGIALMLTFVARPLVVALLLSRARLTRGEKTFIAWAGMRGAVPILLAAFALLERADHAPRVYGIVFVVVMFSVVVQGTLVGPVARASGVPMTLTEPEPWHVSVRLRDEPRGLRRYVVAPGSAAAGVSIRDLPLGRRPWISLVLRDGAARQPRGSMTLEAGDEVLLLGAGDEIQPLFEGDEDRA